MTVSFFSFNCGSNRDEKRVIFLKRQTDVDGSAQGPRKIYYKVRGRKGRSSDYCELSATTAEYNISRFMCAERTLKAN